MRSKLARKSVLQIFFVLFLIMALRCENFIMGLSNHRSNTDFHNLGQELNCACPQRSLSIDILQLLAFVEVRLFNVFFSRKEKQDSG